MVASFKADVLYKYPVQYYFCNSCLFIQTEKPYWLDEAYGDAIASSDTGLVIRNFSLASKLSTYIFLNLKPKAAYLDIAGGYGMLTRLMRDFGFNYFWSDPYCKNLHAIGFEKADCDQSFLAISTFEVLEHVEDPVEFISNHLKENQCKVIIFSTELFVGDAPPSEDWWYYSFSTGQHISFFSEKSLRLIAKKLNLNFYSFNGLHVLSDSKPRYAFLTKIATKTFLAPAFAFLIRFYLGSKTAADSARNILRNKPVTK